MKCVTPPGSHGAIRPRIHFGARLGFRCGFPLKPSATANHLAVVCLIPKNRKQTNKKRAKACVSLSADRHLALTGFRESNIPDVTAIKFIYEENLVLTSSATIAEYVYRINSLFDPNFTGVGGQPPGFDQWKLLYGIYRVLACKIDLEFCGENGFVLGTMCVENSSASFADPTAMGALRYSKSALATNFVPARMSMLVRVSDIFGVNDETVLTDDHFAAVVSGNPANVPYLHIAQKTSGTGDIVLWRVRLTFYTRLEQAIATDDALSRRTPEAAASVTPVICAPAQTARVVSVRRV